MFFYLIIYYVTRPEQVKRPNPCLGEEDYVTTSLNISPFL